jgi:hypothetical protein
MLRKGVLIRHVMTPTSKTYTVDLDSDAKLALKTLKRRRFDMAPVRDEDDRVVGYLLKDDLKRPIKPKVSDYVRNLTSDVLLSATTPLLLNLRIWQKRQHYLVFGNGFAGIVTYADLNKSPARLVFYVLISEIENKLRRFLRRHLPEEEWMKQLEEKKRHSIVEYFERDKNNQMELDKTAYLQFSDLLSIIEKTNLFRKLGYAERSEFEKDRIELVNFRNGVMHSHPLVGRGRIQPSVAASEFGSKLEKLSAFASNPAISRFRAY